MQTTLIFQHNLHTNLNTSPNVSQVPGNLRRKILLVAVGTTRALLFQPHHRREGRNCIILYAWLCEQSIAVATESTVTFFSARMMSSTPCNVSGVAIATGRPDQCSSSIIVRPSENLCTQLWTAWRYRQCLPYMGRIPLWISFASISFCPQKTHNAKLLYRGTCIQGRRHLVTAATSVQSCGYRSLWSQ